MAQEAILGGIAGTDGGASEIDGGTYTAGGGIGGTAGVNAIPGDQGNNGGVTNLPTTLQTLTGSYAKKNGSAGVATGRSNDADVADLQFAGNEVDSTIPGMGGGGSSGSQTQGGDGANGLVTITPMK